MPGLWKLPRCGNGGKIDQRKQSFCLSFFHSFPHRLENSALQENPPEATQPSFPQFPQPLFLLLTYPRPDLLILPRPPLTYPLFRIWWDATQPQQSSPTRAPSGDQPATRNQKPATDYQPVTDSQPATNALDSFRRTYSCINRPFQFGLLDNHFTEVIDRIMSCLLYTSPSPRD